MLSAPQRDFCQRLRCDGWGWSNSMTTVKNVWTAVQRYISIWRTLLRSNIALPFWKFQHHIGNASEAKEEKHNIFPATADFRLCCTSIWTSETPCVSTEILWNTLRTPRVFDVFFTFFILFFLENVSRFSPRFSSVHVSFHAFFGFFTFFRRHLGRRSGTCSRRSYGAQGSAFAPLGVQKTKNRFFSKKTKRKKCFENTNCNVFFLLNNCCFEYEKIARLGFFVRAFHFRRWSWIVSQCPCWRFAMSRNLNTLDFTFQKSYQHLQHPSPEKQWIQVDSWCGRGHASHDGLSGCHDSDFWQAFSTQTLDLNDSGKDLARISAYFDNPETVSGLVRDLVWRQRPMGLHN